MKKILIYLGGVFLVLIVAVIIGVFVVATQGNALDKESKAYVDRVVPQIVKDWNRKALLAEASPELKTKVDENSLEKLFLRFQELGEFREYQGSDGQAHIQITTEKGKTVSANYLAKAGFSTGPAEIQVSLIKHDESWQISGFRVNSDVFLK